MSPSTNPLSRQARLRALVARQEALAKRPNEIDDRWDNGIFARYRFPVLTNEHVPVYWRYDLNPASNPRLLERLGMNAVMNSGAIYLDGRFFLVPRLEGVDRKSFFALAESPNGIDRFRFHDHPILIPEGDDPATNMYDMRLTQHEDGWIYGVFCVERKDRHAPAGDTSSAEAQCGIVRTKDLRLWERLPDFQSPSPQQRNVVLHPELIGGQYAWYTRPQDGFIDADSYIRPLVRHLRRDLKLRRLKWLGLFNEPIWGKLARDPDNFYVAPGDSQVRVLAQTYREVRRALDEDGENDLGIIGPGHLCSWQMPPLDFLACGVDPSPSLAAWDMHAYFHQPDWMPEPTEDFVTTHSLLQHTIRRWVDFAGQQGKPFFITEMGTFFFGRPFWGQRDYETAGCHSAAIHDAQFIVRAINEGVDGFLRWALCVDPVVDGRWGLIEWPKADGPVVASPNIYPAYRALMQAIPPRSRVRVCRCLHSDGLVPRVHAVAVETPEGLRRVVLVHDRPGRNSDIFVRVPADWVGVEFRRTVVDEMRKGEELPSIHIPESREVELMITPHSITVLKEADSFRAVKKIS